MAEIIIGCGVDIIEIDRIAKALQKQKFIERVYTDQEQQLLRLRSAQSWAARFAAKEAVMKALGCGWNHGVRFTDIEILREESGKPAVNLFGQAQKIAQSLKVTGIHISLSHNRSTAVAFALCVGEGTITDGSCDSC